MNTLPLANINGVKIQISNDAEKLVSIRHLCDALGVSYQGQIDKINDDDFLRPSLRLSLMVGDHGKQREMQCLPLKYVFGWLATINPKNVSEEARPAVMRYKIECYDVLYQYFYEQTEFIQEKEQRVRQQMEIVKEAKRNFRMTKNDMYASEKILYDISQMTYNDWKAEKNQMSIEFPE